MALLDDCDLLFMVRVLRRHSGKSVFRNTLTLADSLLDDRTIVSSIMLRRTSGALFMWMIMLRLDRCRISPG